MTILELLNISTEHLKSQGITNPKTSCEILLAHALGLRRLDLYLKYDQPVTEEERQRFKELYKRRLNREPLQYIIGETEFMSLPFTVNPHVLIPRPETELVVETTIKHVRRNWGSEPVQIVDIGVGCGNIAVSLAHYLPGAQVTGFDISQAAVDVAIHNAERNNLADLVTLAARDLFECAHDDFHDLHLVISNPPYVSTVDEEFLEKDVVDYEPHVALFAGKDGLRFFHQISELARSWLRPGGLLIYEIGYEIGDKVVSIIKNNQFTHIELLQDYARNDRIVIAEKPENQKE
ncbi:peptide chain release factor N(5)-glutamine methyltransferase [candidate division KSB1 bacterium]